MNYIQILYLCILKQLVDYFSNSVGGCELHSNLVSLHSETTSLEPNKKIKSCELHSNLVSLHSETTLRWWRQRHPVLWITFKSCIFAFWNNRAFLIHHCLHVVNYIQILYLCILKQLLDCSRMQVHRCELHSNLVSLHSETTQQFLMPDWILLWITFKSCIFAFWNNAGKVRTLAMSVVNYIQILYLCILKQRVFLGSIFSTVVNYIQILYLCILKQLVFNCSP